VLSEGLAQLPISLNLRSTMSKGPGLFTDIGKKAKGIIIIVSLFFYIPSLIVKIPVEIAQLVRAFMPVH
jgi:hypothetical protein